MTDCCCGNPEGTNKECERCRLLAQIATLQAERMPFKCPQCSGHYFGSTTERRPDGSLWMISEDCHDQHGVGCNWRNPMQVMIVKPK